MMRPGSRSEPTSASGRGIRARNAVFRAGTGVPRRPGASRGLILIVVLILVVLLAVLTAGFTFAVRANLSGVHARQQQFQARIAAESGIQRAILQLRKSRDKPENWFDNRAIYRQAPLQRVEGEDAFQTYSPGARNLPAQARKEESKEQPEPVWRFSLYAPRNEDERQQQQQSAVRYGLMPETARLDLNRAKEEQLRTLIEAVVPAQTPNNQMVDREAIVQCIMDWKEPGETARPKGAKSEYYRSLRPGYQPKLGRFDTVEELLLVKGVTGWVLYGEDYNRNGLLDVNEDDGNATFPPDDADGKLFRGLAPYLTVFSRELNTDTLNKPRVQLNMKDKDELLKQLTERGIDAKLIDYIMRTREKVPGFRSVMDLLPVPPPEPEKDEQDEDDEDDGPTTQPGDSSSTQPATQPSGAGGDPTTQPAGKSPTTRRSRKPKEPPLTNLTDETPPGTAADLPAILDHLTADPTPFYAGRINVAAAPREVLLTLSELSEQDVDAIVSARGALSGDDMRTPAWLLTQGLISERTFRKVLPKITASSSTFAVDAVGFADHVGVIKRIGAVLEMRGPVGQVLYYRDLTPLGPAYTPHGEEIRSVVRESNR